MSSFSGPFWIPKCIIFDPFFGSKKKSFSSQKSHFRSKKKFPFSSRKFIFGSKKKFPVRKTKFNFRPILVRKRNLLPKKKFNFRTILVPKSTFGPENKIIFGLKFHFGPEKKLIFRLQFLRKCSKISQFRPKMGPKSMIFVHFHRNLLDFHRNRSKSTGFHRNRLPRACSSSYGSVLASLEPRAGEHNAPLIRARTSLS